MHLTITHISTDGTIGFRYGGKKPQSISLEASDLDTELLRGVWATEVTLSWTEETTSHPRRSATKIVRTVTGVDGAPALAAD